MSVESLKEFDGNLHLTLQRGQSQRAAITVPLIPSFPSEL